MPTYYYAMSNNPIADRGDGAKNVFENFLKFTRFIDIEVTAEGSSFFNPNGLSYFTKPHLSKSKKIPFVFLANTTLNGANTLAPVNDGNVIISNAYDIDKTNFSFEIKNTTAGSLTYKLRAFIYEFID